MTRNRDHARTGGAALGLPQVVGARQEPSWIWLL
jgi:hypothetical protein